MRRKREKRNGFTIIEIMAVIIILGLLATVVAVNVVGKIDKARVTATKTSLKTLHNAVRHFYMDTTRYPDEEIGLEELIEEPSDVTNWEPGGYLETTEIPKDAWGNPYEYRCPGEEGRDYDIISYGLDGTSGGEGENSDIVSWKDIGEEDEGEDEG